MTATADGVSSTLPTPSAARTLIVAVAATLTLVLAGCTDRQLEAWTVWYHQDPVAAVEFASRPEIQAMLAEPAATATPTPAAAGSVWDDLAWCESGQTWDYNGRSGYDGGLQFAPSTWRTYGGGDFATYAWQASREAQIAVAERVLADVGWQAWPTCSRKLGLR